MLMTIYDLQMEVNVNSIDRNEDLIKLDKIFHNIVLKYFIGPEKKNENPAN